MGSRGLLPCPVCDALAGIQNDGACQCQRCGVLLERAAWQRLADAARLARAVGRLATVGSINVGLAGTVWLATCGPYEALRETPDAALCALAEEVRE